MYWRTATVVLLVLATGSWSHGWAQSFKGQTLRVQTWGGNDAIVIQKHVVEPFERETGAKVVLEYGNTAAAIAKARAQKSAPQLDVIFLDDIGVHTLAREGILDKLDLARMPHAREVHSSYVIADGFGIGLFNYIATILYNEKVVTPPPKSWKDLWDPKYKGKVLLSPVASTQMLLLAFMAARLNGGGLDNLGAGWPKMQELKPNIHSVVQDRALGAELLKSGEAVLAVDQGNVYKPYIERGYPIAMTADLSEGYFSITGAACVIKQGPGSRDVAYAFIDRALTTDAQKGIAQDNWYGPTNPKTQLSALEQRYVVHSPEQFARAIQVDRLKLLEFRPVIIEEWNKVMIAP